MKSNRTKIVAVRLHKQNPVCLKLLPLMRREREFWRWYWLSLAGAFFLISCASTPQIPTEGEQAINVEVAETSALYAMMSYNAYHDAPQFAIDKLGWQLVKEDSKSFLEYPTNIFIGLAFDIWENKLENKFVFAFRGTEFADFRDLVAGTWKIYSPKYQIASSIFEKWIKNHQCSKIIVTGHSLGGAIALELSKDYGVDAIVFNPLPITQSPNNCSNIHEAKRVLIYEEGEFLEFARAHFELCRKLVSKENIYVTTFIDSINPETKHSSLSMTMGLLKMALRNPTKINPKLEEILKEMGK